MTLALEGFSGIGSALLFLVACVVSSNFIFSRALGVMPFANGGDRIKASLGMGVWVTVVMTVASLICFAIYQWALVSLGMEYLALVCFLAVIAALTLLLEQIQKKRNPERHSALGKYFPLILGNSAVLGVVCLNTVGQYDLVKSLLSGAFSGLGFLVAIVLIAAVRERLETSKIPKAFRGFPITLVSAGLMSLAFMGFMGVVK